MQVIDTPARRAAWSRHMAEMRREKVRRWVIVALLAIGGVVVAVMA